MDVDHGVVIDTFVNDPPEDRTVFYPLDEPTDQDDLIFNVAGVSVVFEDRRSVPMGLSPYVIKLPLGEVVGLDSGEVFMG